MGVFYILKIVQMVPNHAKHHIFLCKIFFYHFKLIWPFPYLYRAVGQDVAHFSERDRVEYATCYTRKGLLKRGDLFKESL